MPNSVINSSSSNSSSDNNNLDHHYSKSNISDGKRRTTEKLFKMETVCNAVEKRFSVRRAMKSTGNSKKTVNMSYLAPFNNNKNKNPISYISYILVFMLICVSSQFNGALSSSSTPSSSSSSKSNFIAISQLLNAGQAQQQLSNFDSTQFKNVQEAIRNHPDLREFGTLCELDDVKEIISMDRMPLTVFAPIDRSLSDVLAKAKSRSINLIELAKHHIAQGFITPEESTKFPFKFATYSLLSPLYLNQVQTSTSSAGRQQPPASSVFVNNAKILATYLIPIHGDQYQTLHVIDQVIEFAYVQRKAQFRSGATGSSGGQSMLGASNLGSKKTTTVKKALNLDDLMNDQTTVDGVAEFYDRFGDLMANQPQVDLFHARALKGSTQQQPPQRLTIESSEFKLDRLGRAIRQHAQQLRGKLFQVNESNSLNTYFLPMNNDDLDRLLESPLALGGSSLLFEALVIPDQVLFTRTMSLGVQHPTLALDDQAGGSRRVSLNLAKSLPDQIGSLLEANEPQSSSLVSPQESSEELSRKLLAAPLLLQAKHAGILTSSEILLANIPLNNGVLHLIKKPALVTSTKVLDYLNDNDNQLSDLVNSIGSRTGSLTKVPLPTIKVNRFRELLARERQMLSTFSMDPTMNKTILAPSDEAFARLRYDLRALVQGDESMIPQHWDASYRHDLLERLVKRHVILHQSITSDQMIESPSGGGAAQAISDNGKQLNFRSQKSASSSSSLTTSNYESHYIVECDNMEAHFVHYDLIGTDGVLHIIDRVLGEDQETVYSLMKSIVLKFVHSIDQEGPSQSSIGLSGANQLQSDLARYIESNLRRSQELISTTQQTLLNTIDGSNQMTSLEEAQRPSSNELSVISKSIGQYLDELASSNRRQMQLLGASVNISYQLARLTSLADGLDDWNDKFKQPERMFTYFVPSDLAWLRLQQAQPELYKPLLYFLDQQQQQAKQESRRQSSLDEQQVLEAQTGNQSIVELAPLSGRSARSSESSHRLRQILERHLVVNKKLSKRDLDQMETIQTVGATLRLVDAPQQQHLTATFSDGPNPLMEPATSNFAALHSISGQQSAYNTPLNGYQYQRLKTIRFGDSASANIVQVNEASNGFVYIVDSVLLQADDPGYIVQTSSSTAISSSMSSLLGAHNSAILDFIHNLLAPSPFNMSAQSTLALLGTLLVLIAALVLIATLLLIRRSKQNKLNQHRQLESGFASSSSANSGSTSTTKSL